MMLTATRASVMSGFSVWINNKILSYHYLIQLLYYRTIY